MLLLYFHAPALSYCAYIEKPQTVSCSQFSTDAGKETVRYAWQRYLPLRKRSKTKHIYYALHATLGFRSKVLLCTLAMLKIEWTYYENNR